MFFGIIEFAPEAIPWKNWVIINYTDLSNMVVDSELKLCVVKELAYLTTF